MKNRTLIILLVLMIILMLIAGCDMKLRKLKKQEFKVLKQNVSQILGSDYKVKSIDIKNEGYMNQDKSEYTVDFSFDLNKPLPLLPSTNLPGRLVFKKDRSGEWKCVFNTGNPSELFNILRL
ncbi:MAG TPA: hypothetical protein GXX65_13760 [Methanosarcina sp.]|nr:hypothetical protein [Methanosarcina sp.]